MNIQNSSKTKIIATIGPASSSEAQLGKLIMAGIDVCRLNFSHGSYEQHAEVIRLVRKLNKELGTHVALLGDLQGPKIRLGVMEEEGVLVKEGDEIIITGEECKCTNKKLYISYSQLASDIHKGDAILVDDGKLKFEAVSSNGKTEIVARVIHGGPLYSKKGVNLPDTRITIPSLTEKDLKDVHFMLEQDIDWIALSFVRWASDILALRKIIKEKKRNTLLVAKIEKPEALIELDQIIEEADAVMVARGDLGVEISFEKVPYIQKLIVQKSIRRSTPVIVATQMLESMVSSFRPTRAEANDVANAVYDCADTLMLSGETSVGDYPIESINSMQRIIDDAEGTDFVIEHAHVPDIESSTYIPDSVCYNACKMADQSGAKAIIVFAPRPQTGFRLASNRPNAPIYAFTPNHQLINQLSLVWGVQGFYIDANRDLEDAFTHSIKFLKQNKLISNGDIVVQVSGLPIFDSKGVSSIKLSYV